MNYLKIANLSAMLVTIALAGCATVPTPQAARVAEVGSGMVSGCHLLGVVRGSSLKEGLFQASGVMSAKAQALENAAKWGANAVVWTNVSQNYWTAEKVTGNAYHCPRETE